MLRFFLKTVLTRGGSSSPSPIKVENANPKDEGRKKAIAIKPVKRKQAEVDSHKRKVKAKRVKFPSEKDLVVLEGFKQARDSSSSVTKVFINFFLGIFIVIFY